MQIITNNAERQFLYGYDVPDSIHAEFDHLDDDSRQDGWIHYHKCWYHVSDFMVLNEFYGQPDDFIDWHGYSSDSFFSGVLIRISDDGETYQIATYIA